MRLRTWLPPGVARGLGRRLLLVIALAPPIAWLAQAVLPGTAGYGAALTRSLAISLCAWAAAALRRFLLRGRSAQPHHRKSKISDEKAPQTRRSSKEPRGIGLLGSGGTASRERCWEVWGWRLLPSASTGCTGERTWMIPALAAISWEKAAMEFKLSIDSLLGAKDE